MTIRHKTSVEFILQYVPHIVHKSTISLGGRQCYFDKTTAYFRHACAKFFCFRQDSGILLPVVSLCTVSVQYATVCVSVFSVLLVAHSSDTDDKLGYVCIISRHSRKMPA